MKRRLVLGLEERLRIEQVQKKGLWSCFQRRGDRRRRISGHARLQYGCGGVP